MLDILIVEDNSEIAGLLCDFLRAENFTVSVANSGEKALDLYERYGAKLLVLDIMLPGLDGFELTREVRAHRCNTPILMLTARSAVEESASHRYSPSSVKAMMRMPEQKVEPEKAEQITETEPGMDPGEGDV